MARVWLFYPMGIENLFEAGFSPPKEGTMNGKMDDVKGKAKEAVGALTDDEDLKREGKADQAAGKAKDAVNKAKDWVEDKIDDLRHKAD